MTPTKQFTDEEREAYRKEQLDRAEGLLDKLESEEGFRSWIESRRYTHRFSFTNQVLIALQAEELGIAPDRVQAAWRWRRAKYHPVKGSKAMYVWVFASRRRKDQTWTCCGKVLTNERKCPSCLKVDHYFKLGPVFAASQVIGFETKEPPPPAPEVHDIEGDELAHFCDPLAAWAVETDDVPVQVVEFEVESEHGEGGYYKPSAERIAICSPRNNAGLATLIHEVAHAAGGVDYELFERGEAELIVELVALCVCSAVGLDISGRSIPYVAGWAKGDSKNLLRKRLSLINDLARRIEGALEIPEEEV